MRMNDLDMATIEADRVRSLQARFPVEHSQLLNWGRWSNDERGIRPVMARNAMFDYYRSAEDYAEEPEATATTEAPARAERSEEEDYDEKSAVALNDRINCPMLSEALRLSLKVAYVTGGPREHKWYVYANCSTADAFLERLEACLKFVSRFV